MPLLARPKDEGSRNKSRPLFVVGRLTIGRWACARVRSLPTPPRIVAGGMCGHSSGASYRAQASGCRARVCRSLSSRVASPRRQATAPPSLALHAGHATTTPLSEPRRPPSTSLVSPAARRLPRQRRALRRSPPPLAAATAAAAAAAGARGTDPGRGGRARLATR
eukprot:scaffold3183_cov381-Prasinococcus_capsulatus_cf.AAC.16